MQPATALRAEVPLHSGQPDLDIGTRPELAATRTGAHKLLRRLGLIALPWLFLVGLFLPSALFFDAELATPNGWHYVILDYAACFFILASYTPLIGIIVRRYPLRWPPAAGTLAVHLCSALAMTALHVAAMAGFDFLFPPAHPVAGYAHKLLEVAIGRGPFDLMLYVTAVVSFSAWDALQRFHQRERSIVQAQLDALKAQIEPHFLFNTLNALSELVYRDPAAADRALTQLSRLLRQVVDGRAHQQTLREEIAMSREYLSIQQILLGERLRVVDRIDDALLDALVPTLLLQPLLENAIRHGVAQLRSGGAISMAVRAEHGRLLIEVGNDGPTRRTAETGSGMGLANTRARLAALHGDDQRLQLEFPAAGGAQVRIELPLQRSAAV